VANLGLELRGTSGLAPLRNGGFLLREGDAHLGVSVDGRIDGTFAAANRQNRSQISMDRAISLATDLVARLQIETDAEVAFDQVRLAAEGGATEGGSGTLQGPFITETTVQFRQLIDGVPVVAPGAGELHVTVDNDGTITALHSSLRGLDRVHEIDPASDRQPSGAQRV